MGRLTAMSGSGHGRAFPLPTITVISETHGDVPDLYGSDASDVDDEYSGVRDRYVLRVYPLPPPPLPPPQL